MRLGFTGVRLRLPSPSRFSEFVARLVGELCLNAQDSALSGQLAHEFTLGTANQIWHDLEAIRID